MDFVAKFLITTIIGSLLLFILCNIVTSFYESNDITNKSQICLIYSRLDTKCGLGEVKCQ